MIKYRYGRDEYGVWPNTYYVHIKEQRAWSRDSLKEQKRVPLKQVDEQSHVNSQPGIRKKSLGHVIDFKFNSRVGNLTL